MHLLAPKPRRSTRAATLFVLATACATAACNGKDTTGTSTKNFTTSVALSADSLTVPIGDSLNLAVTVTRGGGYTDAVTLAIDTLPTGVTYHFSNQVVGIGATASILTVVAGPTAVPGNSTLRLRLSGFDVADDTTSIRLTVVSPAIAVVAGTTSASAAIGGAASIPVTVQRVNGYAGPIYLTAENVPSSVTVTFVPALVENGAATSTLILAPISGATASTSTIVIRAAGNPGVIQKTTPFAFTISAPSALADYSPSATPAAISLVTGSTAQTIVALNRAGGLASNITFAVAGLPTGVSASIAPNPATAATTTITFTATAAVAVGTYNLTLTGSGTGTLSHTIPLVLNVVSPHAISVSLVKPTLTVAKGGINQSAVLVTRAGGLNGAITLTTDSLPTGITASFAPSVLTGAATGSVIGLSAGTGVLAGTYLIVVRGTTAAVTGATPVASVTGSTTLTVVVPP